MQRYQSKHYEMITRWLKDHNKGPIPENYLPELGFIVPGVAVGFALQTSTPIAFLEYFIANPKAKKDKRRQAITLIAQSLITELKQRGIEMIRIDSQVPSICRIAEDLGFGELMSNNYILSLS